MSDQNDDPTAGTSSAGLTSPGDETQNAPIMSGSDEATDDEKAAGLDEQARADEEFYRLKDTEAARQPDPDASTSPYLNPAHSDLSHGED